MWELLSARGDTSTSPATGTYPRILLTHERQLDGDDPRDATITSFGMWHRNLVASPRDQRQARDHYARCAKNNTLVRRARWQPGAISAKMMRMAGGLNER